MAKFKNDPFPGTDYSKYAEWEKVTTPDGEVFYVVPGHPEYVLDITASNASGDKVFRRNPKGAIADAKTKQEADQKLADQAAYNSSFQGQATNQLLSTGGTIGSLLAAKSLGLIGGSNAVAAPAAQAAAQGATTALSGEGAAGINAATDALGATGGGDVVTAAAPEAGFMGSGLGLGPLAAIAAQTYLSGQAGWDELHGKKPNLLARGALDLTTFGLNEAALPFLTHKTTRQVAQDHTADLLGQNTDDKTYQDYVTQQRQGFNSGPTDPSKPFGAGKYGSWDEYKTAGLDPNDLSGVYGNIKTFGPEWANLSQPQRVAVTKGIIDAGLYDSSKGEVEITDPAKAQEIKDNVLKGFSVGTQAQAAAQGTKVHRPGFNDDTGQRINY